MRRQKVRIDQLVVPTGTPDGYVPSVAAGELAYAAAPGGVGGGGSPWTQILDNPLEAMTGLVANSGTWTAASGQVSQTSTAGSLHANCRVDQRTQRALGATEVEVQHVSGAAADMRMGIFLGYAGDNGNGGMLMYAKKASGVWNVLCESRGIKLRFTSAAVSYAAGNWLRLSAVHTGGGVGLYADGALLGMVANTPNESNDASFTGLYTYQCGAAFRNLKTWGVLPPFATV